MNEKLEINSDELKCFVQMRKSIFQRKQSIVFIDFLHHVQDHIES
jgi:hypothetical protein